MGGELRSPFVWFTLMLIGFAIAVAWCLIVVPALFVAEAGARLTLSERALVAAPMAVGSALMLIGGRAGKSAGTANLARHARVFDGAVVLGVVAAVAALLVLLIP